MRGRRGTSHTRYPKSALSLIAQEADSKGDNKSGRVVIIILISRLCYKLYLYEDKLITYFLAAIRARAILISLRTSVIVRIEY